MQNLGRQSLLFSRNNRDKLNPLESRVSAGDFDNSNAKYHQLKDFYEMRLKELSETLANTATAIANDSLLLTMRDETTSQQFFPQRVREIIEECIHSDREALIQHLSNQYALLEEESSSIEQDYERVIIESKHRMSFIVFRR